MNRKKKYRRFLLFCLGIDLMAVAFLGYRYLDRKIPDEILVIKGQGLNMEKLQELPFVTFEDSIAVSGDGSYLLPCRLLGAIPFKDVKVTPTTEQTLLVSGSTVGIYMETEGVLIVDTGEIVSETGETKEPARNIVRPGDYIVAFNDQRVGSKKELISDLEDLEEASVTLDIVRDGATIPVSITPVKDRSGSYKLGIWVRDDTQGIGTLTYVDGSGTYGALGHGISDVDTGDLLSIKNGALYRAQILGIQKGTKGSPGELSGVICYEAKNVIGTIRGNSENGIFGQFETDDAEGISLTRMPVGYKQDMELGPATIRCCVGTGVQEYEAEITKIDMNHEDSNKSFVIHITDEELISRTGGIIQGMSGSPVIQNGRIVGAVTHVLVNDAARGYGIFIENMLEAAK